MGRADQQIQKLVQTAKLVQSTASDAARTYQQKHADFELTTHGHNRQHTDVPAFVSAKPKILYLGTEIPMVNNLRSASLLVYLHTVDMIAQRLSVP